MIDLCKNYQVHPGMEPDIFIWGATGGASFATRGAVNGLCRTFKKRPAERDLMFGGSGKNMGGSGPPWHPPSSAPECIHRISCA